MSVRPFLLALVLGAALTLPAARGAAAQIQGLYNPRDDQYRVLGLVRAQAELERASRELERAKQLFDGKFIAANEFNDKQVEYERARVAYMQQALAVLFAAPHVTIERAVKVRAPDGRSSVRLTLRNTTGGGVEGARVAELIRDDMLARLRPDEISDVYVSLKLEPGIAGATISRPYERRIAVMRRGQPVTVSFGLLRDADEVVVSINYADKVEERKVYLEKDASANMVAIVSSQFSQEADLGGQAIYDLQLERFTADQTTFRLAATGLPRGLVHEFRDPDTGARLTQIRFLEGESQKRLQLAVSLPERVDGGLAMDRPVEFAAVVLDGDVAIPAGGVPADAADRAAVGRARLELVPRGVARVEVRAANLYHELRPGASATTELVLHNTGSRRLEQLRVRLEAPGGWAHRVEPAVVSELPVGAEATVRVALTAPDDAAVGDYEARLRLESAAAAGRRVEAEDKLLRLHVASATGWLPTAALVLLLIGLGAGVVLFGVRLGRR